jgi:tRNA-specific 2-thiouridylase
VQFIHAFAKDIGAPVNTTDGDIVSEDGAVIGRHNGVHNFTIGQRKGLGFSTGKPLYVLAIDVENNRIIAGDDDALRTTSFEVEGVNWVSIAEPAEPIRANVKIRHKHEAAPATIQHLPGGRAQVTFDQPQRAITPGQGAVAYAGDVVLFGGWIK